MAETDSGSERPWSIPNEVDYDWIGPHGIDVEWAGYDARPSRDDADETTDSLGDLFSTIDSASSGDVIWLDDGEYQVDGESSRQDIPSGVTVAADGARIYSEDNHDGVFELTNDGARLTGFRLEGSQETGSHDTQSFGVFLRADVQLDNCEFSRWMSGGVYTTSDSGQSEPHIHHCMFVDNRTDSMGYGVAVYTDSTPLIEYNYFNDNRHGLASNGADTVGYRARNNLHGPDGMLFQFEQHDPGGDRMEIEHNEFRMEERNDGGVARAYAQRGTPEDVAIIEDNWIYNPLDPADEGPGGDAGISQTGHDSSEFVNVEFDNNHYGTSEPSDSDIGIQELTSDGLDHPTPTADLSVFAEDAGTGSRIEDAAVSAEWLEDNPHEDDDEGPHEETTDENGEADFGSLPVGFYELEVSHEDYETRTYDEEYWRDPAEGENEAMELDEDGRDPVLHLDYTGEDLPTEWGGETDSNGIVDFGPAEQHADYTVEISAEGYHTKNTTYTNESEEMQTLELDPVSYGDDRLAVFVTDRDGSAISGVTATLYEAGDEYPSLPEDATFHISHDREGIEFESLADFQADADTDAEPEGLAYHDGHLYTGERDDPATIREWDLDGEPTGEEIEVPGGATNMLKWVDDELWVSSGTARETYIIDWGNEEIVDEIEYAGPISNSSWREIVPDSNGDLKLIFPLFRGDEAYLVDAEDARDDGTTDGNIDRELDSGYWYNTQTMLWDPDDEHVWTTTHEHVIKHRLPYVDEIPADYELLTHRIEWLQPMDTDRTLEQLTADEDRDEFYLLDRDGSGEILVGNEVDAPFANGNFGAWDTTSVSGHVEDSALDVDSEETEHILFNLDPSVGRVEVWFYDDGNEEKRVYPAVTDMDGDATNLGVATHQDWGDESYGFWDGDWEDTGIDRVEDGWVKFAWEADGNEITAEIRTDSDGDWEDAGTSSRSEATIRGIRIQHAEGEALVGPWTVDIERDN